MRFLQLWKSQYFYLGIIIVLAFLVRLYKIDTPLADWHSWRQADTAAVARNFYKEGFNPFMPKYDDMSGVAQNPVPNPNRYRFVEFPIYNSLIYFLYLINNGVDIKLARLVSIVMSLGSIILLFLIVRKYGGKLLGLISAGVFAFLPYNIYFSRVILPEPTLVFFCLGMFYFTDLWIWKNSKVYALTSIFFTSIAFLIKPVAIFYLLPLLYSYHQKEGRFWKVPNRYLLWLAVSFLPFLLWRIWMNQFPEGIPASDWLFNGTHIRFKPAFWKWILGDRFGREILTVTGTFLFFLGLLKRPDKESPLLHLLAFSLLLYLVVFATGNVQHDYYQTLIIPGLAIFVARGFLLLIKGLPNFVSRIWTIPLAVLFFLLIFYLGWQEVKGLYQINNEVIVEAGEFADKILPKEAIVVAPYNGDTAFLYQINRHGWAVVAYPAEDLTRRFNVSYYISVNYDARTNWVMRRYKVIEKNPKFTIVDLTSENPNFNKLTDIEPN